ncbi:MAG: pentapeptide repeat-containing protein [Rectinema sp.]|nr:pentapeptide repeat-containing protein [Rectinema sp.]
MFSAVSCTVAGCSRLAYFDTEFCYSHLIEKDQTESKRVCNRLRQQLVVINRVLDDAVLTAEDFSRLRFIGCSIRHTTMQHVMFTGSSFRLTFLDHSTFTSCDFSGIDMNFCSIGNATFIDCSFENSELIQANFNGCKFTDCTFSSSNLYNSRFMLCELEEVHFDNCDFKRAFYLPRSERGTTFVGSNIAEAVRDREHLYL